MEFLQARILEWVAFPFSRDLPNPGIKPRSPALQVDSLPAELQGSPCWFVHQWASHTAKPESSRGTSPCSEPYWAYRRCSHQGNQNERECVLWGNLLQMWSRLPSLLTTFLSHFTGAALALWNASFKSPEQARKFVQMPWFHVFFSSSKVRKETPYVILNRWQKSVRKIQCNLFQFSWNIRRSGDASTTRQNTFSMNRLTSPENDLMKEGGTELWKEIGART